MLEFIRVTTTGSAGSATGETTDDFLVHGLLLGVRLDYHASAPVTTVVTITEAGGLKRTLLTAPASATDVSFNPHNTTQTTVGVNTGFYEPFYLDGVNITVTVTASNALTDAVVVVLSILKD